MDFSDFYDYDNEQDEDGTLNTATVSAIQKGTSGIPEDHAGSLTTTSRSDAMDMHEQHGGPADERKAQREPDDIDDLTPPVKRSGPSEQVLTDREEQAARDADVTDFFIKGPPGHSAASTPQAGAPEQASQSPETGAGALLSSDRGDTQTRQVPRPLSAVGGASAAIAVAIAILTSPAWLGGGAVACLLTIAVLHRHVWRWPPAVLASIAVGVFTLFGGALAEAVRHVEESPHHPGPSLLSIRIPRSSAHRGWIVTVTIVPFTSKTLTAGKASPAARPATHLETTGRTTHTWTDYASAAGSAGGSIPAYGTVRVACRVSGSVVPDGDSWWYRIASNPWDGAYYASADAFYNNTKTSGALKGSGFVDPKVPNC